MLNENPENRFQKQNLNLQLRQMKFEFFFIFVKEITEKLCQVKLIQTFCLMLSVYKSYHQTVKYGRQRNHILQDLNGLEIQISTTASKLKNQFEQLKSGL